MDAHRLTSALSDRYRIESEIDTGGMATVYRARDLKHERTVAIKVLRPDLAEAIGADRFLREIRTTANLSHPHILPLHDSGEAAGFLFYVMPFVEGESLADRLEREGQLPVEDAVQIAREVADALEYAHEKGVIHRDVKPANIMLKRGHALLADFGIAQARAGAEEIKLTGSGMSLGTPSYMSPEQISGDRALDGRADQYALGCVLYEMLAGRPPFEGADIQTVMRQHLAAEAPKVTGVRATVPAGVAKALHRALSKSPADRFRSMGEFEKALAGATLPLLARIPMGRARVVVFAGTVVLGLAVVAVVASVWRTPAAELDEDRVAVLPFENQTGNPDYDIIGLLLAEEITSRIDQGNIARTASAGGVRDWWKASMEVAAEDRRFDPRAEVAERFHAGILLSGSFFVRGDSLRFFPEIRMAREGWEASRYPTVTVSSLSLETGIDHVMERITAAVAGDLDPEWGDPATTPLALRAPAPSLATYRAMDQMWDAWNNRDWGECRRILEEVLDQNPTYYPAATLLAVVLHHQGNLSTADSVLTAVEPFLDEMALGTRGQWEWIRATVHGEREEAYQVIKEYQDLVPNPLTLLTVGTEAFRSNRPREAWEVTRELHPEDPVIIRSGMWTRLGSNLGNGLHLLGKHRRELREVRRLRAAHPDHPGFLLLELRARAARGQVQEVARLVEEAIEREWNPPLFLTLGAFELRAHGKPEESRTILERLQAYLEARPADLQSTAGSRFTLAQNLFYLERLDEAEAIVSQLLEQDPSNPTYPIRMGYLAAKRGDRERALEISEQLAATKGLYDLGFSEYHRACIAALLGDLDDAVSLLRAAYEDGYQDWMLIHVDPDLESLWGYPPFEEFRKPRG